MPYKNSPIPISKLFASMGLSAATSLFRFWASYIPWISEEKFQGVQKYLNFLYLKNINSLKWTTRFTNIHKMEESYAIYLRGCKGKMNGGKGWNLSNLGVDRDPWEFYLMFLSREINIKLCQIYMNIYVYKILYKNRRFKQIIFS